MNDCLWHWGGVSLWEINFTIWPEVFPLLKIQFYFLNSPCVYNLLLEGEQAGKLCQYLLLHAKRFCCLMEYCAS